MKLLRSITAKTATAALVASCCQPDPSPAPAPPIASAQPAQEPGPPVIQYPTADVRPLAEDCQEPHVILDASSRVSLEQQDIKWRWSRQIILANPHLRVVSQEPQKPGEIRLFNGLDEGTDSVRLVGRCADAATCNHLAAAHHRVSPNRAPQPVCGKAQLGSYTLSDAQVLDPAGPEQSLPTPTDITSQCVRIAACILAAQPDAPQDPARECLSNPGAVKLGCSLRKQCDEVIACLDQRDQ